MENGELWYKQVSGYGLVFRACVAALKSRLYYITV